MTRLARSVAGAGLALLLCGCAMELVREHPLGCRLDERRMVRDTLHFDVPGRDGDPAPDRDAFAARIAATFPDGFTVLDAHGYRAGDARSARRVVVAIHPPDAALDAAVRALVAGYRQRFPGHAVLRERSAVCVPP